MPPSRSTSSYKDVAPCPGIEARCCQVMLQCSTHPCVLRLRLISAALQLPLGTSSVREFVPFSVPTRRSFPEGEVLALRSAQHNCAPLIVRIAPSTFARNDDP